MQKVVFDEPYEFIPPGRGRFWPWVIGKYLPRLVRTRFGVIRYEASGLDYLRESLKAGHGIILSPNHCRPADPILNGVITTQTPCLAYAMASWHVFKQTWLEAFVCRQVGAFSVYREGLDRKALDLAVEIVANAERPLIIFAEGVISAANDRLMPLMDGISFVARAAARKRAKTHPQSKVVIHPVAFRYQHEGDPDELLSPTLERLEQRIFWRPQSDLPLLPRIRRLRTALQSAREVQWLNRQLTGSTSERMQQLSDLILARHEERWLGRRRTGDIISRVKDLRIAILSDMVAGKVTDDERRSRWRDLTDIYYAQSFSLHPPGYLDESLPVARLNHRMFETVERLEEELTDTVTNYEDLSVRVSVGPSLEVDTERRKRGAPDSLMTNLRTEMLNLLGVEDQWPPVPVKEIEDDPDMATETVTRSLMR